MKVTFNAEVPVLFFPDLLDDDRTEKPTLQFFRSFKDEETGPIRAFLAIDGSGFELKHPSGATSFVSLDDIFRQAIKTTFGSLHLDAGLPRKEHLK
ncbi:hypothetical protein SAMN04488056_1239 [Cohaesibacter marisflavi]|uniref:Uncharacterized protein n=1 Tax=Cohaesibacter marisflavi TaxID=655353 RepID=A0A1I5MRP8_9HYPH|nr:hypothetical protein [Cohaesibacter marisflavi]SFP12213.1 hypothetical protein SAMN04488056_1239 [Cohaesibacter marisflavi]